MPLRATFRTVARLEAGRVIAGCGSAAGALVTWGDGVTWRETLTAAPRELPVGSRVFAEGGCLLDVDRDGRLDLVLNEDRPKALAWYRAPQWQRHLIDTGVVADDILPATILGRRGVLLIHQRAQLRFYEIPADPTAPWPARDVYSVYTPSWQGGLALGDVDRDGRGDIYCGNYWVRAPLRFDLPWRLFAINTWTEEESSGMLRLAPLAGGSLAVAQRLRSPGRVAVFRRPPDPRQLWPPHMLGEFDRPNSLLAAGSGALVAEAGGVGRVLRFDPPGWRAVELRSGAPVRWARRIPGALALVTADAIEMVESAAQRAP